MKDIRYALMKKSETAPTPMSPSTPACTRAVVSVRSAKFGTTAPACSSNRRTKADEAHMVTLKAEEITSDIAKDGRAVFYGIQFDFDKAELKPESEPQLAEMAKALEGRSQAPRC